MKHLLLAIRWKLGLCLLLALPNFLYSQITLTSEGLLSKIGSRQVVLVDRRDSIPVDLGSPGADQIWDFRSAVIADTVVGVFEFMRPEDTPTPDLFPGANMVSKITTTEAPGTSIFSYFDVQNDFFLELGDSSIVSLADSLFIRVQAEHDTIAPLPVAFNNSWRSVDVDSSITIAINPVTGDTTTLISVSVDSIDNLIDGWGTVRLPLGDFECLRLRQDVKVMMKTLVDGTVVSSGTETFIQYNWISPEDYLLLDIQSQFGNADPDFTDAQGFALLDTLESSPTTGISDAPAGVPAAFALSQNYPNPFNPETIISYQVREASQVRLTIFNLLGQSVRQLVSERVQSGQHQVVWDGMNDSGRPVPSGVYVYRLQTGEVTQSRKMILLK
ncbi:MAG: FlgD immunoglobulin-like domain containing protein [bacterium]